MENIRIDVDKPRCGRMHPAAGVAEGYVRCQRPAGHENLHLWVSANTRRYWADGCVPATAAVTPAVDT